MTSSYKQIKARKSGITRGPDEYFDGSEGMGIYLLDVRRYLPDGLKDLRIDGPFFGMFPPHTWAIG